MAFDPTLPIEDTELAGVALLAGSISNPPTQAEMNAFKNKVNELIAALHRT